MRSLYTNIPNNEGIKSVREGHDNHPNKTLATEVVITFLHLILILNNFAFNSIKYFQVIGMQWVQSVLQHTQIISWHKKQHIQHI